MVIQPITLHRIEDFTEEAISRFLTVLTSKSMLLGSNTDKYGEKVRKEKLREMMLRFHPDKEAVGQIVRSAQRTHGRTILVGLDMHILPSVIVHLCPRKAAERKLEENTVVPSVRLSWLSDMNVTQDTFFSLRPLLWPFKPAPWSSESIDGHVKESKRSRIIGAPAGRRWYFHIFTT
ncbi:hypothetical protein EDC04DRAFT_1697294 [Pisolithus marmoratus]|nr:hypothetical protein EDC04DRAFT_1697294 [Pisolithus marmoratus]